MYNEQLEKLIDMALVDGELTEKEKQILFKKAEAFGVDLDEFEMVLEAKLYEKQQSKKSAETPVTAAPKSDKLGDVKKCPACGSMVGAFKAICSDCGHEFSNVEATNSTQKLYNELLKVEEEERNRPVKEKKKDKKDKSSSFFDRILDDDFDDDDDEEYTEDLREARIESVVFKRKAGIVSIFPVPNTKADIIEFMILAVSEGGKKIGGFFSSMSDEEKNYIRSWRAKAEQVVAKARFSLKEDKRLLDEINQYAKQLEIK
jgi:hypothetical protein